MTYQCEPITPYHNDISSYWAHRVPCWNKPYQARSRMELKSSN